MTFSCSEQFLRWKLFGFWVGRSCEFIILTAWTLTHLSNSWVRVVDPHETFIWDAFLTAALRHDLLWCSEEFRALMEDAFSLAMKCRRNLWCLFLGHEVSRKKRTYMQWPLSALLSRLHAPLIRIGMEGEWGIMRCLILQGCYRAMWADYQVVSCCFSLLFDLFVCFWNADDLRRPWCSYEQLVILLLYTVVLQKGSLVWQ